MRTKDAFYPGFELAGVETPVERALTMLVCKTALALDAAADLVRSKPA